MKNMYIILILIITSNLACCFFVNKNKKEIDLNKKHHHDQYYNHQNIISDRVHKDSIVECEICGSLLYENNAHRKGEIITYNIYFGNNKAKEFIKYKYYCKDHIPKKKK